MLDGDDAQIDARGYRATIGRNDVTGTALREPLNLSGAMTMRTAFPSRAEFIRTPWTL